jgi:hypothetical protein
MSDDSTEQQAAAGDDLLWGTAAISAFIGLSLTETQYLIRKKKLPIGRLGPKKLFASRRALRRHLTATTQLIAKESKSAA